MKILKLLILLNIGFILTACTMINTKITASANINPDINNTPSPVAVSIFELTDDAPFQAANFFNLYSSAAEVLGPTLLYEKNIMVVPGENMSVSVPYVKGARFIAYIAAFRNLHNLTWRGWVGINPQPVLGQEVRVLIDSRGIHVFAVPRSLHPS